MATKITIGPEYTFTTAPKDYDYGWTEEINPRIGVTDRGKTVRLVKSDDPYRRLGQCARYGSGLYPAWDNVQFAEQLRYGFVTLTPDS
jgi:hypothetical protein